MILVLVLLLLGLAECFFGYKMFRVLNMIKGFITGGLVCGLIGIGIGVASAVNRFTLSIDMYEWLYTGETAVIVGAVIGFLIGGILGALLANALFMLALFFQSFVIGALFGAVAAGITRNYDLVPIAALVTGLLLAITSCILFKHMKIVQTALEGAFLCGIALGSLNATVGIVCAIILCVAGIIVQQMMQRKETDNPAQMQAVSDPVRMQAMTPADTQSVGNSDVEYMERNGGQKLLANLFQRDIFDEIRYVFPEVNVQKIRYYPVFSEDGGWICSCGNENSDEVCIFCGMSKKDIQEKLNFTYLNEHMQQRRRKIEEERKKQRQETKEKTGKIIKKVVSVIKSAAAKMLSLIKKAAVKMLPLTKKAAVKSAAFVKKHKKKLLVIVIIASLGVGGYEFFIHNSTCMMKYYLFRAEREEDSSAKYQYYRMALNEKENPESYLNMISITLENGSIDEAIRLNDRARELYADDSRYQELEKTLYPTEPYFITEGGNYDRRIAVEIGQSAPKYNQIIHYTVNSQSEQDYHTPVAIDASGSYGITAWTTNDFGYASGKIDSEYIVDIEIPDMVTASIEPGEYQSVQYVELSQSKGETIYYTTDGSNPNQSAYVYNGPIECGFGVNKIKAICYSANGEPSDIMDHTYYVSYEDHSAWNGFSGYYYDYVCVDSNIRINDKKSGTTIDTIPNAGSPNEYQGRLYYIDFNDGQNIKMYSNGTSSLIVPDADAVQMMIAHDSIYFFDTDFRLIRTDIDGSNRQLVYDYATAIMKSGGKLYFYSSLVWFCIDSKDAAPTVLMENVSNFMHYVDESTYVYFWDGCLHVVQNGTDTVLFEEIEQYNTYTSGLLFRYKVEDRYIHDICNLDLSNHCVTYVYRDLSIHTEYSWANESAIDKETSTVTYTCMMYNLDTGETISLGEGERLFMADDAYYIDGVRINMAH